MWNRSQLHGSSLCLLSIGSLGYSRFIEAIGNQTVMYLLGEKSPEILGSHYVAPGAAVIGDVIIGNMVSIWFNAVLRADNDHITIGEGSNIQDGSVLHVDEGFPIVVGERVTVGHRVMLHGCTVGNRSLIGMNAVVLNGAVIGEHCLIGANALVTEGMQVPDGSLVLGSPGKVVKQLSAEMLAAVDAAAQHYIDKIELYQTSLQQVGT